ncbi:MAG: addiction module antitoxin RelB [Candidatus Omnitrophota bacterium]|jgi:putative addiction module component (TIGR02574 family)|nr:MAG: addiction module antitoxin RelB [Candidatus Omnitrophota bacterium]
MTDFEEISLKAMALPVESRAELAEILIQSLDEDENEDHKSAWLEEIHRRDQEIRVGASITKTADQVLREARETLRCLK